MPRGHLTLLRSPRTYIYEQQCLLTHLIQITCHGRKCIPRHGVLSQVFFHLKHDPLLTGQTSWGEEIRVCVSPGTCLSLQVPCLGRWLHS